MEQVKKEEIITISMNVILHAGNAREFVFKVVNKASKGEFNEIDKLLQQANKEITRAHRVQTDILQTEAEGTEIPYSPLFGHAQDTLMTVKSEINMMREIIKLYEEIKQ
ncbi:PTS lactose/cellobiose transporter subunit IIA [Amphibacillus sp. Q70]|uniref:PTS lactose/cellobiose transporter subunit IIA n=1 Tax=Amphibacillus sp. Q70 TaxID=3453416 RepID=UPI003F82BC0B